MIIIGVGGKGKANYFTLALTCQSGNQIFQQEFLIVPSYPTFLLGWDILTKLGAVLQFRCRPLRLLMLQVSANIPENIDQQVNRVSYYNGNPRQARTTAPVKVQLLCSFTKTQTYELAQ